MKVILVNGSSRKGGCTGVALNEVARGLRDNGIETEHFFIGNAALPDCIGLPQVPGAGPLRVPGPCERLCGKGAAGGRLCVRLSGVLRPPQRPPADADGTGHSIPWFRLCLQARGGGAQRPAAGTTASFDVINKYFTISSMPVCPPTTGTMSTGMSRRR